VKRPDSSRLVDSLVSEVTVFAANGLMNGAGIDQTRRVLKVKLGFHYSALAVRGSIPSASSAEITALRTYSEGFMSLTAAASSTRSTRAVGQRATSLSEKRMASGIGLRPVARMGPLAGTRSKASRGGYVVAQLFQSAKDGIAFGEIEPAERSGPLQFLDEQKQISVGHGQALESEGFCKPVPAGEGLTSLCGLVSPMELTCLPLTGSRYRGIRVAQLSSRFARRFPFLLRHVLSSL